MFCSQILNDIYPCNDLAKVYEESCSVTRMINLAVMEIAKASVTDY